jgi:hypothetical protein
MEVNAVLCDVLYVGTDARRKSVCMILRTSMASAASQGLNTIISPAGLARNRECTTQARKSLEYAALSRPDELALTPE